MSKVFIIYQEKETAKKLETELAGKGFQCSVSSSKDPVKEQITKQKPDLVIVEMNGLATQALVQQISHNTGLKEHTPVMALADRSMLGITEAYAGIDDFVVKPYDVSELTLRAKRLLKTKDEANSELIKCGALTVDLAKCEVMVGDNPVELTFKEYELLKFLARDRGRVYTRETLLNKVWGYDYFGGDRTVDVHIRRLRSKLEASGYVFIETVRNIGYRFKKSA